MLEVDYYRVSDNKTYRLPISSFQEIFNSPYHPDFLNDLISVGDVLIIDAGEKFGHIPFEVMHCDFNKKVMYLMADKVLGSMPFDDVDRFLDNLLDSFPDEVRDMLKPISHTKTCLGKEHLISIPSTRNLNMFPSNTKSTLPDDIVFNYFSDYEYGTQTKRRRRNKCSKKPVNYPHNHDYWTDTGVNYGIRKSIDSTYYIRKRGDVILDRKVACHGVCPIIKFAKDK